MLVLVHLRNYDKKMHIAGFLFILIYFHFISEDTFDILN